jgi:leader peptidase (prepilin peptidase)/N-methyltransferase
VPTALLLVILGVFGLAVGSFLNVVIVRVPSKESLLTPPSQCPLCETPIATRDNIPVLSWLLLRGKCRSCREPIPVGYPLVEAGNAFLWVVAGLRFHSIPVAVGFALFFSVLLALSVIDLELSILPDRITLPSAVASMVLLTVLAFVATGNPKGAILGAVIGGVGYSLFLFVVLIGFELIAHKEGMGFGDVKLALVLGLWLGWIHPILVLFSLIAASFTGLLVGVGYLVVRRKSMPFPFGPWLAIGAVGVILAARPILSVYGL